ncbi:hypothetical protein [Nonomuraea rubra]
MGLRRRQLGGHLREHRLGPGNAIVTIDHDYRITKTVRTLTHCIE